MSTLFQVEDIKKVSFNPTSPRPQVNDEIRYKAALRLATANPELNPDLTIEDIADAITQVSIDCCSDDGYYLAKELDDVQMWDIDADKVRILATYEQFIDYELKKVQWDWVETNNIKAPFPIGQNINFVKDKKEHKGTIYSICDSTYYPACYVVLETKEKPNDTEFSIVKFEDCWITKDTVLTF